MVNNTVYEKKHRYMLILKQINVLYNQADIEVSSHKIPAFRAKQIKDMYNQTLVGLIEEGIEYQYLKNEEFPEDDLISITVDGINYRCKNTDIYNLLKDKYESVMGIPYTGPMEENMKEKDDDYKIPDIPKHSEVDNKDESFAVNDKTESENSKIESFTPPPIYITPESDFGKKKEKNAFSTVKQVIHTLIVFAIMGVVLSYIWKDDTRRENITNSINSIVTQIKGQNDKQQSGSLFEDDTQEEPSQSEEEPQNEEN